MQNYKTTILGIFTLLGAISAIITHFVGGTPIDWMLTGTAATSGIGLLTARDAKKTDLTPAEQVTIKQVAANPALGTK